MESNGQSSTVISRTSTATFVEEESSWVLPYGSPQESLSRARFGAVVTLSLAVLGSSVLPVPFAFSKTGVVMGLVTMAVVAYSNELTSRLLTRAAAFSGKASYEELAEWAGGYAWKVATQCSLMLLLFGTMCGGLALVSDIGLKAVKAAVKRPPEFLVSSGRPVMCLVAVLVLYPLCLQRKMRQLERVATLGVVLVAALSGVLGYQAIAHGFPAIKSGELPLLHIQVDRHLPEAFAVLGYAFYMQPMMMPLLQEMPQGPGGLRAMEQAIQITLYGVAVAMYGSVGIFGAGLFGQETAGDILVNPILEGRLQMAALYALMVVYLAVSMTTTQFALRACLDQLLLGPDAPFTWTRQVALTTFTVGSSLTVALLFPEASEKIFAVTGATVVCIVCYVVPVFIHFHMYRCQRRMRDARRGHLADGSGSPCPTPPLLTPEGSVHVPLLPPEDEVRYKNQLALNLRDDASPVAEAVVQVVLPVVVLLVGVVISVAALWVVVQDAVASQ